ncbi:MAG: class I SAM-dependent methyltransferase [Polaromonas sp.]|uniref:class I SAM-dependent methyltransferase n=1 Tax=Polaromonas sp. TaxID=1869339 RepID=UPI002732B84E|nr:class I SAM-dependent methyltransferase [Polaromonas sp.]MDP2818921.1 class I SAM-dependent methyltransferase [Polaromonas sp.]
MQAKSHWDEVYSTKSSNTVSWYQPHATLSLEVIRGVARDKSARIVDVGGGASSLVDDLLADGMTEVSVLDISGAALDVARRRLGKQAARVNWMEGDITTVALKPASIDIWHDRAVFHFLTDAADRAAYVAQVRRAMCPGGHVIVAAFGPEGPLECSGLPVVRYAPDALHAEFGGAFELIEHMQEDHHTPAGLVQHFVYCHCVMH